MPMERLSEPDIERRLAEHDAWSLSGGAIQRTFSFASFADAVAFVGRVADLAEALQHHPDILIRYSRVTLTLTTHDAGGLTERDFAFARQIDAHGAIAEA